MRMEPGLMDFVVTEAPCAVSESRFPLGTVIGRSGFREETVCCKKEGRGRRPGTISLDGCSFATLAKVLAENVAREIGHSILVRKGLKSRWKVFEEGDGLSRKRPPTKELVPRSSVP